MHTYCGSCNVIKMYRDDLPTELPVSKHLCHDKETAGMLNARYPIRYDHNCVVERYAQMGKAFAYFPFPSTIYVLGTGDNISSIYHSIHNGDNDKRFHPVAFLRNMWNRRRLTRKIKKEFGME